MGLHDFLEDREFVDVVQKALMEILHMLLKKDMPFTILTNTARVVFKPQLPKEIIEKFQAVTLFILDGYTLSSAQISNGALSFEAGFGDEDFASVVSVPLGAVLQIAIEDRPIFLNMSIDIAETKPKPSRENNSKRSMEALMNNPDNEKLLKK